MLTLSGILLNSIVMSSQLSKFKNTLEDKSVTLIFQGILHSINPLWVQKPVLFLLFQDRYNNFSDYVNNPVYLFLS